MPKVGDIDYSRVIDLDLSSVVPSVSGPRRPQDRVELPRLKERFTELYSKPTADGGFAKQVSKWESDSKYAKALTQAQETLSSLPSRPAPTPPILRC